MISGKIGNKGSLFARLGKTIVTSGLLLGLLGVVLATGSCRQTPMVYLRQEIGVGDRQKDWALVYYQSWRRDHKPEFLKMAREQMALAIQTYYEVQLKMGHSFPDFYQLDIKRRESCDFLAEMERMGFRFQVRFDSDSRKGCFH